MSAPHGDSIVSGYLAQLALELAGLPDSRRDEILEEIRGHITEARSLLATESDADVLNILDRVGDPAQVASAARPDATDSPRTSAAGSPIWTSGWLDIAAAVLTPVVWPVGVILLWMSSAWSVRDKLIGTLVPPGGYIGVFNLGLPVMFLVGNTFSGGPCTTTSDSTGTSYESCTGLLAAPGIVQFAVSALFFIAIAAWLLLPVSTGLYLALQLRRRSQRRPSGVVAAMRA